MSDARTEVLRRIRAALRDHPSPAPVHRDYRTADAPDQLDGDAMVDLLVDRLTDYKATVHRCEFDDAARAVAEVLARRGTRRMVVPPGLDPGLIGSAAGVEFVTDDPPLRPAEIDGFDGVVTTCAVAVAETGTIVLDAGRGQGRRVISLVPDYHLVVVSAPQVVGSVPAAIARLDPTRPLTWISGPSATSDIELDRVEGVHGPRTLDVVLVAAAPARPRPVPA